MQETEKNRCHKDNRKKINVNALPDFLLKSFLILFFPNLLYCTLLLLHSRMDRTNPGVLQPSWLGEGSQAQTPKDFSTFDL
jgi:hypothetical protein